MSKRSTILSLIILIGAGIGFGVLANMDPLGHEPWISWTAWMAACLIGVFAAMVTIAVVDDGRSSVADYFGIVGIVAVIILIVGALATKEIVSAPSFDPSFTGLAWSCYGILSASYIIHSLLMYLSSDL